MSKDKVRKDLFKNPLMIDFKAYYSDGTTFFPRKELSFKEFDKIFKDIKKKVK